MAERTWTVREAMAWTVEYFERKETPEPRRSAEWLLSAATGLSRVELYAHSDRSLSEPERAAYRAAIERRAAGEPLQYVTGEMPFRHIVVHVAPGVFIPRPETEVLVDEALSALEGIAEPLVVEVCTGSGAVAASLAFERPGCRVWATDVSEAAVEAAGANADRCGVGERVDVFLGDLFSPLPAEIAGKVDLIVANPPYIPTPELADLPGEVRDFEPGEALDGGEDGLDVVRRIINDARSWLRVGGTLAIETDTACTKEAAKLMSAWYEECEVVADLNGRDRIARGRLAKAGEAL